MPALNFQGRFASAVETHRKRQTIRPMRKRPIKLGDTLYFYRGWRTKDCFFLCQAVCRECLPITINEHSISVLADGNTLEILPEGGPLEFFAHQDGFDSWEEMRDWFKKRYGLPFEGVLITW